MRDMGADSIAIKDMAGLLTPYATYDLVKALKSELDLPVVVHSHSTAGLAQLCQMKAIEAGADHIDTAISSFASGTSHPATESQVAALKDTPMTPDWIWNCSARSRITSAKSGRNIISSRASSPAKTFPCRSTRSRVA